MLIVVSQFDQSQTVGVDRLRGSLAIVKAEVAEGRPASFEETYRVISELKAHFAMKKKTEHLKTVVSKLDTLESGVRRLENGEAENVGAELEWMVAATLEVAKQAPSTLLRLRLIEIILPLLLSSVSLVLTFKYPLTEKRIYEIKAELERRREAATYG